MGQAEQDAVRAIRKLNRLPLLEAYAVIKEELKGRIKAEGRKAFIDGKDPFDKEVNPYLKTHNESLASFWIQGYLQQCKDQHGEEASEATARGMVLGSLSKAFGQWAEQVAGSVKEDEPIPEITEDDLP